MKILSGFHLPKIVQIDSILTELFKNIKLYTVGHKKEQLIFACDFVQNQWILMQFSLLDFKMNDACESMNFLHLN